MEFYQFLADIGVHHIDYSGEIDLAEGLSRMEKLDKVFSGSTSSGSTLKILLDFRNTVWNSQQTHDTLAKIARQKFGVESQNSSRYIAIVNNRYDGTSFENERWFTSKEEALNWLAEQSTEKYVDGNLMQGTIHPVK
jgi:hypothetical protein